MIKIKAVSVLLICFIAMLSLRAWALEINSGVFENGGQIGSHYTCDADNVSPSLSWSGAPSGTKSFALICEDPDSPSKVWSHWVIFNIPAGKTGLAEDVPKTGTLNDGTIQGINDFGRVGYGGPCPPPDKTHRYFFRLYALDKELLLDEDSRRGVLLREMRGHVLAEAQIYCTYQRM